MDMSQYLEVFIEESREHLQSLNQCLLSLESNPEDMDLINEIFRAAHTLKGMSATMGFTRMSTLTHDMENVLQLLRNKEMKVDSNLVDLLFQCLDALENYVNEVSTSGTEGNAEYKSIISSLNLVSESRSTEGIGSGVKTSGPESGSTSEAAVSAEAAVLESSENSISVTGTSEGGLMFKINEYEQDTINRAVEMNYKVWHITVRLSPTCLLKSARAFIVFQTLEKCGDIIKSVPPVQEIEDEKFDFEFQVGLISNMDDSSIKNALLSISEVEEVIIEPLSFSDIINEQKPAVDTEKHEVVSHEDSEKEEQEKSHHQDSQSGSKQSGKVKVSKSIRVDIDRLDVLMNLVSELIIIKTRFEGIEGIERGSVFYEALENLSRTAASLHDAVMKVRMVPVETVFNRFPRMVRDISRELGKDIVLHMSGEDTELDRTVNDEIGEPLIHLLRNSIDHGIESPEARIKAGKPRTGNIYLRAYQDGNNVVIEVEDDGAGVNIEKVRQKAVEKGLVSKEVAQNLTQKEIIELLFRPSFSTADKISDISGRGVGMDVVKTKIESLGGTVEMDSMTGKGSKTTIRLPLTLAMIKTLLVQVGDEKYAIPQGSISIIDEITGDQIRLVQNREVLLTRNQLIPIIRLDKLLEVPRENNPAPEKPTVVIVRKGDKQYGLVVDFPIGQQEIVQKPLGKLLSGIRCLGGATILGDGNVALILDVNSISV